MKLNLREMKPGPKWSKSGVGQVCKVVSSLLELLFATPKSSLSVARRPLLSYHGNIYFSFLALFAWPPRARASVPASVRASSSAQGDVTAKPKFLCSLHLFPRGSFGEHPANPFPSASPR